MKFFGLASVAALATTVLAQDPRNVTTLAGTWSSGSRSVVTGSVSLHQRTLMIPAYLDCAEQLCRALRIRLI